MSIKNKILLSSLLMFLVIISLGFVSAATTINAPAASTGIVCLNSPVNITTTDNSGHLETLVNFTVYMKSSLTANNTWTIIGTSNNFNSTTTNNTQFLLNFTGLEDANDYIINVTLKNSTGGQVIGADTNTAVRVDCTVPVAPSSLTPTSDADGASIAFSSTVTGSRTTSCQLFFFGIQPPGAVAGSGTTMTHSGNTCSYTWTSTFPEGIYTYFVRASDGTNTTDSSTQQVGIDIKTSSGKAALLIAEGKAKSLGGSKLAIIGEGGLLSGENLGLVISLAVIGVALYFIFRKK